MGLSVGTKYRYTNHFTSEKTGKTVEPGDWCTVRGLDGQGDPDMVSVVFDNGLKLTVPVAMLQTEAQYAAAEGHLEVVRCLHEVMPDTLWAENKDGETPADLAEQHGHQAVVDYLSKPWTPLMHAAADRRAADVERLLHRGADPTVSVTHEGRTDTALTLASTKQGEHEVCHATVELIMGALA